MAKKSWKRFLVLRPIDPQNMPAAASRLLELFLEAGARVSQVWLPKEDRNSFTFRFNREELEVSIDSVRELRSGGPRGITDPWTEQYVHVSQIPKGSKWAVYFQDERLEDYALGFFAPCLEEAATRALDLLQWKIKARANGQLSCLGRGVSSN